MRTLLIRRAGAQARLLVGLLALVTLGITPLGVAALLLGPSAQRAFDVAMAREPADAVDVTAIVTAVAGRDAAGVVADGRSELTGVLDPLPVTTDVRASSAIRELGAGVGYLGAVDDPARRVRVLTGRAPSPGASVPEADVPRPVAAALRLRLGEVVRLGDEVSSDRHVRPLTVRVVGTVAPLPAAGWSRDPLGGVGVAGGFFASPRLPAVTAYGPFLLTLDDLVRTGSTLDRLDVTAHPDLSRPSRAALETVDARFGTADARLTAAVGNRARSERIESALPATLAIARTQESVTRSGVLVVVLLATALAAMALALAGRLVVTLRQDEAELLSALGAGRGQLAGLAAVEAGIVAVAATALAIPLAGLAHAALTHLPAVRRAGLASSAAGTPASVLAVALGALLLASVLVLPTVLELRADPEDRRDRRGLLLRSGTDVLAVAFAAVGLWQLRGQPAVSSGADAVRVAAPAVCLLAGALLALRVAPPLLALADRWARSSRALVLPLAAAEANRRSRAAAVAVLVTLGATSACFAPALVTTWDSGRRDQADLRVGTDLAVSSLSSPLPGQAASLPAATGGTVSPAARRNVVVGGWLGDPGAAPQLVAIDTRRAGPLLRGRAPQGRTWARIGAALAPTDRVRGISLTAAAAPSLRGAPSTAIVLTAAPRLVVQDRSGLRSTLEAAPIPLDGRDHRLELTAPAADGAVLVAVDLRITAALLGPPSSDLVSAPVDVRLRLPGAPRPAGASSGWSARSAGVDPTRLVSPAARLVAGVDGTDLELHGVGVLAELGDVPVDLVATAFPAPPPVPVAVSAGLASAAGLHTGSRATLTVGTTPVPARVVDVVPDVPSEPGAAAVLADVDLVSRALLATGDTSDLANGWWVGDVSDPDAADRVRALGIGDVASRAETTRLLTAGPLSVALPVALTGLAPLAVVLVLAGAGLAVTADLEARIVEIARLRALGVRRRDLRRGLVAQHVAVLGLLLLAGMAVAAVAARVLGPLLVRSDTGGDPVPAVRPLWPWPIEAGVIAALALGVAGIAAVLVVRGVRRADAGYLRAGAS